MSKNIYQDKEWKVMRDRLIKDKCELCESTDRLSLHHKKPIFKFKQMMFSIACNMAVMCYKLKDQIEIINTANEIIKNNQEFMKAITNSYLELQREYYYSGKDTMTVCISCHHKIEKGIIHVSGTQPAEKPNKPG